MSENIQSISQGTYTIGQTSATKFVAGNGIKIDEPSAGTVRIGNDETVLWSGTNFTYPVGNTPINTTVQLSESFTNFDQIRLDFSGGSFFAESVLLTHPTTANTCFVCTKKEQNNNNVFIGTHYKFTNDTTLSGYCSYGSTQYVGAMTGGYWGYGGVVRVIGINRISGGNE